MNVNYEIIEVHYIFNTYREMSIARRKKGENILLGFYSSILIFGKDMGSTIFKVYGSTKII